MQNICGHPDNHPSWGMFSSPCCQRAICGAKKLFRWHSRLKLHKNKFYTVKDQFNITCSNQSKFDGSIENCNVIKSSIMEKDA